MPGESQVRLASRLERIDLPLMRVLCEAGSKIDYIYFPRTSVLSLLSVAETGDAVETATIGREGAFGLVLGMNNRESFVRCVVQSAGSADRISPSDFKREFDRSPDARRVVMYYIEVLLIQYQQSVLCHALHPVEARVARWLVTMSDRADSSTLFLTQEFLAEILGVARTTEPLNYRTSARSPAAQKNLSAPSSNVSSAPTRSQPRNHAAPNHRLISRPANYVCSSGTSRPRCCGLQARHSSLRPRAPRLNAMHSSVVMQRARTKQG
jgi:CRP-like cAMP-binding protein